MPLRVGIMSFAHLHANSYAACLRQIPDVTLVGIADDDPARGQARAAQFETRYFPRYEDLLDASLDAVIVCSENARHKDLTLLAARAGVHVLCEKPLATTLEDAREMVTVCRERGVLLQTAFPCPYSPAFRHLLQAVEQGVLGEILAVNSTNHGRNPGGWFTDRALAGGGAVMDHTVHVADLLHRLLGPARQVYAEIGNGLAHQPIDDTGLLTIDYENGAFATLDTSWSRPRVFTTWGDVTLHVIGTRATASLDLFAQVATLYSESEQRVRDLGWGPNLDLLMVSDFLEAVRTGRPVSVTGEDGLRALAIALAAYESARTGQPVPVRYA